MVLNIGDSAPDFELTDPDMKMRTLGEFRGKKVVLSFIVAASSPVCEAELCTFRDSWNDISNLGAQVVAISNDGPFANKAFAEKHNFNFPLLGDYNSKTIRDYDILVPDLLHLKDYNFAKRSVFIIDENSQGNLFQSTGITGCQYSCLNRRRRYIYKAVFSRIG